jgi:glycosyltransferase involved in cell wall biosynthesis
MVKSLSAVVPAHNEEQTIGPVVEALVKTGVFQDVVVVDDGSTDRTAAVAERAGATRIVLLDSNRGKGRALAAGVERTASELLCFFDADLVGLEARHVQQLAEPVMAGRLAMCIGTVDRGPVWNALSRLLPAVSGQRVLRREMFESIPDRHIRGYGIESVLNYSCRRRSEKIRRLHLHGVSVRRKTQKVGIWRGLWNYVRMWRAVLARMIMVRLDRRSFGQRTR